jgi:MFS family permease
MGRTVTTTPEQSRPWHTDQRTRTEGTVAEPATSTRRWATPLIVVYTVFGTFWGVFGVAFADFVIARDLTFTRVGNQLAVLSLVAVVMMLFVAQRLEPLPRRWSVGAAVAISGVGVVLLVVLPTWALLAAFVVTGVGTGLVDVFVNAAGHEAEQRSGTPVLQRLHAAYSVGAGVAALATGFAIERGVGFGTMLLVTAGLQLLGGAYAWWGIEELRREIRQRRTGVSLSVLLTAPVLFVPALVLAAAYFVEGSMDVWGVLYLREELGASAQVGSYGLAAFSFAMALGRLFAARTLFRFGPARTLVVSGGGAMAAGAAALLASSPLVASASFLIVGFCVAAAGPAALGMAGRGGVDIGVAIAAISTVGYTGFILGPPALGALADFGGVRATMTAVMAATVGIVIAGAMAGGKDRP